MVYIALYHVETCARVTVIEWMVDLFVSLVLISRGRAEKENNPQLQIYYKAQDILWHLI